MKKLISLSTLLFVSLFGFSQQAQFEGMKPIETILVNDGYGGDFHKEGCVELKKKTKAIKHEEAQVLGYMPCSLCFKEAKDYYYKPEEVNTTGIKK